jgi:hypothetical protein
VVFFAAFLAAFFFGEALVVFFAAFLAAFFAAMSKLPNGQASIEKRPLSRERLHRRDKSL